MVTKVGTAGSDTLVGTKGVDKLSGRAGNDRLDGLAGNDTLLGEAGNDTLLGGLGRDLLDGGDGDDVIIAGFLDRFGAESDFGPNTVNGGAGNDTITGGGGTDQLFGGDGDDRITDYEGAGDRLDGGAGNDILTAGFEAKVSGGAGNDVIDTLGFGGSTISGGTGADRFVISGALFPGEEPSGTDRITDFRQAEGDKVDLTPWAADVDQFIGTAAFSAAGQVRYQVSGGTTTLQADFDGDGAANIEILLTGAVRLTANDVLL